MNRLFPNAPESIRCRKCTNMFPNPILNGARGVTVVCPTCRTNMFSAKTQRAMARAMTEPTKSGPTPESVTPVPEVTTQLDEFVFKCLNDYRSSLLKAVSKEGHE